jgi:hypothetical protein
MDAGFNNLQPEVCQLIRAGQALADVHLGPLRLTGRAFHLGYVADEFVEPEPDF